MNPLTVTDILKTKFTNQETVGFTPFDFIHKYGSPLSALLHSHLFWPDFVEIDDMVFLQYEFEDENDYKRLKEALEHYQWNRRAVEESFNVVEISSFFGKSTGDVSDEGYQVLASIVCDTWSAKLKHQFPSRRFEIDILDIDDTDGEIAIIFRQIP